VPEAGPTAAAFFTALQGGDYPGMYALLNQASRAQWTEEVFTQYLQAVHREGMFTGLEFELDPPSSAGGTAQVRFRTIISTALMGGLNNEGTLELALEEGAWRVRWDPGLLLASLRGGNSLKMEWSSPAAERGAIYARNEAPLVAPADGAAVGVWTYELPGSQLGSLYTSLGRLFGRRPASIQAQIEAAQEAGDDYVALGEATIEELDRLAPGLDGYSGVQVSPYHGRFYHGSLAPHLTGYAGSIHSEDLEWYRQRGFEPDELVGQYGLEAWGEGILGGQRGGTLMVVDAQGQPVAKLAEIPAVSSQDIHATIDPDLQAAAQGALAGFRGAAVVLERDTGRVLALASSPAFDPNAFAPANFNSYDLLSQTLSDPAQPLYNRAAEGQYPLGSVFKIITMAAALETGGYTPETNYQCGYTFDELPGLILHDWTWSHFQEDGETQPSGPLTLTGGLIRSCNPFFWHIGLDLYRRGLDRAVSEMARGFGLGSSTGLEELADKPGNIPDPASEVDAVNLAIGQGNLQVTPLQVASLAAAIGNGGTLYRPQVIEKIASVGGASSFQFEPQKRGDLPLKPETLRALQEAMRGVVASKTPRGTAYHIFNGLQVPVAGKTGTATAGAVEPHAWFAGYTFAEDPDRPDIAIAVIVETIGEGSDYAAPIFRRLVETYFLGSPGKLLPWEKTGGGEEPGETPSEGPPPMINRDP
jgi:penicillin-binding protein 2